MSFCAQASSNEWARKISPSGHRLFDQRGSRTGVAGRGEVSAVVGENRVDLVRHGRDQRPQEVTRHAPCGFLMQLGKGEFDVRSMATNR